MILVEGEEVITCGVSEEAAALYRLAQKGGCLHKKILNFYSHFHGKRCLGKRGNMAFGLCWELSR